MTDQLENTLLHEEHLLLGASMEELNDSGYLVPMSYPGTDRKIHDESVTYLFDLTGLPYGLLSGSHAQNVAEMALASKLLDVGESAFEAVLFGDGSLAGFPFVMRCGEHEYCLIDLTAVDDACMEWVSTLTYFEDRGERIFDETTLEDATDYLLPLLLMGENAKTVLSDYVSSVSELPSMGEVRSVYLDQTPTIIAELPVLKDAYLILIPPVRARVFWRSFLSFACVEPGGHLKLQQKLNAQLPWLSDIKLGKIPSKGDLTVYELIRTDGQFVGMRGLLEG